MVPVKPDFGSRVTSHSGIEVFMVTVRLVCEWSQQTEFDRVTNWFLWLL